MAGVGFFQWTILDRVRQKRFAWSYVHCCWATVEPSSAAARGASVVPVLPPLKHFQRNGNVENAIFHVEPAARSRKRSRQPTNREVYGVPFSLDLVVAARQ